MIASELSSLEHLLFLPGPDRQHHAKRILDSKDEDLHISVRKLKNLECYKADFAFAAATGYCGWRLYVTLRAVFHLMDSDVQESERLNKALTLYGDRCPSGSLDLCTSRVALKHYLGLGGYSISGSRKFSDVKDTAKSCCKSAWQDGL